MREICMHGSEGGGTELNRSFLPLSMRFFRAEVIPMTASISRDHDCDHFCFEFASRPIVSFRVSRAVWRPLDEVSGMDR